MARKIFPLLLSEEERAELEKKASDSGLKLSEYVRGIILDGKVTSKKKSHLASINQQVYLEMSRIVHSLKKLAPETNAEGEQNKSLSVELTILIKEIHQYLKELRVKVIEDDWKHNQGK